MTSSYRLSLCLHRPMQWFGRIFNAVSSRRSTSIRNGDR